MNYDEIKLTEEELKAAILEGKKKKFFHDRNQEYWQKQEKPKGPKPRTIREGETK